MKELQTALKGFVKQNETLKIETKVSNLKIFSPWSYFYTCAQDNCKKKGSPPTVLCLKMDFTLIWFYLLFLTFTWSEWIRSPQDLFIPPMIFSVFLPISAPFLISSPLNMVLLISTSVPINTPYTNKCPLLHEPFSITAFSEYIEIICMWFIFLLNSSRHTYITKQLVFFQVSWLLSLVRAQ